MNLTPRPSADETRLNKTEAAYLAVLRTRPLFHLRVQSFTLKLADNTRYTPDFSAVTASGRMIFVEVKGFMRDDARVKLKVAARLYPEFDFILVQWIKKQWVETEVLP